MFLLGVGVGGLGFHTWRPGPVSDTLPERRLEATVFLPLVNNADEMIPRDKWEAAIGPLIQEFGGTTLGASVEGCWRDQQGRMRREPVRPLVLSFAAQRLPDFRQALHEVGRRLGQEAMYVRYEEPRVELLVVEPAN